MMEDYEKIKVVGRGAFGTVYLCRRRRRNNSSSNNSGSAVPDSKDVIVKQIPMEQLSATDRQATLNEV